MVVVEQATFSSSSLVGPRFELPPDREILGSNPGATSFKNHFVLKYSLSGNSFAAEVYIS